jgi:sporulation protein YlmC with PRC-barrel domain
MVGRIVEVAIVAMAPRIHQLTAIRIGHSFFVTLGISQLWNFSELAGCRPVFLGENHGNQQRLAALSSPRYAHRSRSSDAIIKIEEFFMTEVTSITSGSLIAAEKVNGTNVYNPAGDNLGTVNDILIDKVSGRAIYAVMSFGGFLGMGKKHNPLPWGTLKYDEKKGGYVINMDKKQLQDSPNYDIGSNFKWTPEYGRKVDSYYKAPSYWM